MKILWLLALHAALSACNRAPALPPSLPVAEYRFLDADTDLPIEGVWVNFAWNGTPTERGMSSCMRAVLAQSDKDGWVRDTAGQAHWRLQGLPSIFKPGYEFFNHMYLASDLEQGITTARVHQDRNYLGDFPAWEEKLTALGYTWKDHNWTKVYRLRDQPNKTPLGNRRTIYMTTYRSLPFEMDQQFAFVGHFCDNPKAESVGLEQARIQKADHERALASTRYLCRPDWDTIKPGKLPQLQVWLLRAFWLLPQSAESWEMAQKEQPVIWDTFNQGDAKLEKRIYDKTVRENFCTWLQDKSGVRLDDK